MISAVIDTNVLVSGLWTHNPESPTKKILDALLSNGFVLLRDDKIMTEYREVLSREKFNFDKEEIARLIAHIKLVGKVLPPCGTDEDFSDPDDRVFYEVALAEPGAKLVTGNLKHYPVSPIVVTPAQFCELLGV